MMRAALLTTALLSFFAADTRSDILLLRGGGRVEGIVEEMAGGYRVVTIHGRATIRKDRVVGVVEAPYVTEIYEEKRAKIDPADPESRFRLSLWCEGMGLGKQAEEHLRETLLLDPDHLRARARLGYVRFRGVWMRPDEAKQAAMAAVGLIPFEGKWFTEGGLRAYLQAKEDQIRVEETVAKERAEREKAELEARAAEEELKKKEAERKAVEQALARLEADRRERDRLRSELDALRDLLQNVYVRGGFGLGTYGYAVPAYGLSAGAGRRALRPCRRRSGFGLGFEWSRGNLRVRGRVR